MVEQNTNEPLKEDPTTLAELVADVVTDVVDVEMSEEAKPEEEKPVGQSISSMVNQGHTNQIMEMGFTKIVAEKALFMTQAGVEKAMDWINDHMEDEDFNEELVVVTQPESASSKLSLEERQAKAAQLQKEVRARMDAKEKVRAVESEAQRKKLEKETAIAKVINDDRQHKIDIEAKIKEKKDLQDRVAEQRRRYELDMKERFGDQWT